MTPGSTIVYVIDGPERSHYVGAIVGQDKVPRSGCVFRRQRGTLQITCVACRGVTAAADIVLVADPALPVLTFQIGSRRLPSSPLFGLFRRPAASAGCHAFRVRTASAARAVLFAAATELRSEIEAGDRGHERAREARSTASQVIPGGARRLLAIDLEGPLLSCRTVTRPPSSCLRKSAQHLRP